MINKIKEKYFEEKKDLEERHRILQFYFFRPISFYLTCFFIKCRLSPNQVTYISIIFGITGCIFLCFGGHWNRMYGLLLLHFWLLLDNVDGNLARYYNSSSQYGKLIDYLNDQIFHLIYVAMGIGLFLKPDIFISSVSKFFNVEFKIISIILGSLASLMSVYISLIFNKFTKNFEKSLHSGFEIKRNNRILNLFYLIIRTSDTILPVFLFASIIDISSLLIIFYSFGNTLCLFFLVSWIIFLVKKSNLV